MATDSSRRHFISAAAACALAQAIPPRARAHAPALRMLGAWQSSGRNHAGIWQQASGTRGVELPFRAHQVLLDPVNRRSAIAIARRPGDFIARLDLEGLSLTQLQAIEPEFVTNGHALFSADGRKLLVSESDSVSGAGSLGIYDVATLEISERISTAGIGPHALLREPGGTLLVANGGVVTLAQSGRTVLNPGNIDSSLVRLDSAGRVLGEWRLVESNLSIRHLALAKDGTVGLALQAEHADPAQREHAPVLALFDGRSMRITESATTALGGYAGDVACIDTAAGSLFAVGCTRAGVVGIWTDAGRVQGIHPLRGACAVAAAGIELISLSQHGEVGRFGPLPDEKWSVSLGAPAWDNHVAVVQG
jgi:hypothetical protein